jgi:acetyl esterase/lipase
MTIAPLHRLACVLFIAAISVPPAHAAPVETRPVPPTHGDVAYGKHPRNRLDLWLAPSHTPAPLIIYIHGGGFESGDKSDVRRSPVIEHVLASGVSFAAINYRFSPGAKDLLGPLEDMARAVQFLRHHAARYNLDATRFAAYGQSAGAGASLWLGFRDDLAEPSHRDPMRRQSTRLLAVAAITPQASYNLSRWPEMLGVDASEPIPAPPKTKNDRELDMLAWMSADDAPFYAENTGDAHPLNAQTWGNRGMLVHHPLHVAALRARAAEVGLSAVCFAPALRILPPPGRKRGPISFLLQHLTADKAAGE